MLAIATFNNPNVGPPLAGLLAQSDAGARAAGAFGNPNYFGLLQATAIATAVGLLATVRSTGLRGLLIGVVAVLGVSLLLSLSRGAMLAVLIGLATMAFARSRALGVAAIAVGILLVVAIYPAFVAWRLGYTNGAPTAASYQIIAESDQARLSGVLAGPALFLTAPLFGVGWGHYSFLSAQVAGLSAGIASHNWYVQVLAELGTVGIILWMLLLAAILVKLWRRAPAAKIVGIGVLATYAAGSMFLEAPTSFQTSALPIIVILAALVGNWAQPEDADLGRPESPERPRLITDRGQRSGRAASPAVRWSDSEGTPG